MKLVEVQATKEFASTFLNDIFFKMAVNRVLDAAPAVEGVTIQKWIPVAEEIPEQYQSVIGWTKFQEMGEVMHDGKQFVWVYEETEHAFVTHWMPLPEPPNEQMKP